MAFWIILGIIAAAIVIGGICIIRAGYYGRGEAITATVAVVFAIALVGLIVCGVGVSAQTEGGGVPTLQKTWALRALVTKTQTESSAEASFFLGFGTASASSTAVKSIYYIRTAKDGGSTLQKTSVGRAVIYEDGGTHPYVEDWVSVGHNDGAFVPWGFSYTVSGELQHRFHIPKGSILQSYVVTP